MAQFDVEYKSSVNQIERHTVTQSTNGVTLDGAAPFLFFLLSSFLFLTHSPLHNTLSLSLSTFSLSRISFQSDAFLYPFFPLKGESCVLLGAVSSEWVLLALLLT
ncbi:hypothetical protein RJT34_01462 [Clitoria ternatea]|uniref:Uncharacterized protein n=1 Tax=Clitoria ternatea TaxID=43366 RepID=A0AAN9Q193_CLITE